MIQSSQFQTHQNLLQSKATFLKAIFASAMHSDSSPNSSLITLWFRLASLGIVGLVFAEALVLAPGKVQGWTFYLSTWALIFEIVVRLIVAAFAGIALGTFCTLLVIPFLLFFKASRPRVMNWATNALITVALFVLTRFALLTL